MRIGNREFKTFFASKAQVALIIELVLSSVEGGDTLFADNADIGLSSKPQ